MYENYTFAFLLKDENSQTFSNVLTSSNDDNSPNRSFFTPSSSVSNVYSLEVGNLVSHIHV